MEKKCENCQFWVKYQNGHPNHPVSRMVGDCGFVRQNFKRPLTIRAEYNKCLSFQTKTAVVKKAG